MSDNTTKPWEIEPALKQGWLVFLAELLLKIRAELVARQDPSKGDGTYGLGCTCYERIVFSITALAASGKYPWLTLIRSPNLGYAIAIEGCPVRIYRGDSEAPPLRQLERARDQLSLFGSASAASNWFWFIVVETDWRGV